MKHINESIIGRKGISSIPELRNHDIVVLNNDSIYMVLKDRDEIDQTKVAYHQKLGIIYSSYGWIQLEKYDENLDHLRDPFWGINQVYRSPEKSFSTEKFDDIIFRCTVPNLRQQINRKHFNLIWERK